MPALDWVRLHAALNDLPAALLVLAVLFDLLAAATRRESLRAAGFWCLITGALGAGLAVLSGLMVEGRVDHTDAAHAVMKVHETLAYIVLGMFVMLAGWRLVRRGVWGPKEQPVALTAGVIGVALLIITARLGGNLVFDHGMGIPTTRINAIAEERGGHDHDSHSHDGDSTVAADSGAVHRHSDGTEHRH
jgi:uncharacterized membrane protein